MVEPLRDRVMNAPFDPLLRKRLPAPQNPDVSTLQNQRRSGVISQVIPHVFPLLTFEQAFVHLDLNKVPGLQLLPNLLEDGVR